MIIQIPLSFSFTLFTSYAFSNLDGKNKKQHPLTPQTIVITKKYSNGDSCTKTNPITFPTIYDDYINAQNMPKYLPLVSSILMLVMYHGYETHKVLAHIPFIIAHKLTIVYKIPLLQIPS